QASPWPCHADSLNLVMCCPGRLRLGKIQGEPPFIRPTRICQDSLVNFSVLRDALVLPLQHTLSVRISEALRNYLERAREVVSSSKGEAVSTSDVAKMLLELAKGERLDDRLEVTELLTHPTETLLGIRQKWEQKRLLSRAEWVVLAQYIQIGCEGTYED